MTGCALVLAGCAGETGGDSGGGSGAGSGGGGDGITLNSSARAIFETQCADCHGAGGQGGSAPNLVTNESSLSELSEDYNELVSSLTPVVAECVDVLGYYKKKREKHSG